VRLSETPPLSRFPRHRGVGMREVHPKNLGIAQELYISTLNERTRSNEGEESVEILHMSVELL